MVLVNHAETERFARIITNQASRTRAIAYLGHTLSQMDCPDKERYTKVLEDFRSYDAMSHLNSMFLKK